MMDDISPELSAEIQADWKRRNKFNNEYNREHQRRIREKKFGISYPAWWLCDVCSRPISGNKICLDHDHKTGKFRGWLCHKCNQSIEWYQKNKKKTEDYLKK